MAPRTAPIDVGHVDHAVDVAGQADKQPELGNVANLAFEFAADRVILDKALPRIGERLFEAEADSPLLRVNVENHHLDLLAGRDDVAGVHIPLGPAHLRDMHQPLDPRFQFNKSTVVGDVCDTTAKLGAGRVFELDAFPRVGLEL